MDRFPDHVTWSYLIEMPPVCHTSSSFSREFACQCFPELLTANLVDYWRLRYAALDLLAPGLLSLEMLSPQLSLRNEH